MIILNADVYIEKCQLSHDFTIESKLEGSSYSHKERVDAIMSLIEDLIVNSKASNLDF